MKTNMTTWAMLIALLGAAVSCSETEIEIDPEPDGGGSGQAALGITTNLKVEASSKAQTKAVVSGSKLTYTDYSSAPGLGVVVTNKEVNGWYEPNATASGSTTGHHVWYMGDSGGMNWVAISGKGASYEAKTEAPYYLKEAVGKVYAYYPYDENALNGLESISSEASLKIPVTVLETGTIAADINNAVKKWDKENKRWIANTADTKKNQSLSTEKDYLYFYTDAGRNVNNGRVGGATFNPDTDGNNADENNPGYLISLEMQHAMAMVSFRVYDGGNLSPDNVNFTKFVIKNHEGSAPFKTGNGKMSLVDGTITDHSATGTLTREISGYTLMRQIKEGTEGENTFVNTGTGNSKVNGQTVSKTVSTLVYPVESFEEGEIEVVITLKEGSQSEVTYTVGLPANAWDAGHNYIYTFSAGRNKLTIMDVSVTEWYDELQSEIPL